MQPQTVEIHIEQPSDAASTAFCDNAMAASGFVVSKGRKHARKSSSVDQAIDKFFADVAAVENRRVLAHAIEHGLIPAVDEDGKDTTIGALKWGQDYNGKKRVDTYDAIRGMCTADERFRPSIDATLKLGSTIKSLVDNLDTIEIRVSDVKLFVQTYLTEVYLKSDGVGEYLNINELNPTTVENVAADLDAQNAVVEAPAGEPAVVELNGEPVTA